MTPDLIPSPPAFPRLAEQTPISLTAIQAVVADELTAFQGYFRKAMQTDIGLLDRVTRYMLRRKGKQIRPTLVLLSAKLCGEITPATYHAATLVELLHTASLIHDDVVDEADRRRGLFSINALWKNKVSVLFGDFLLSKGLLLALDHHAYDLLHLTSDAVRRMSEGELLQLQKTRNLDIDEATYFRIISDKTASLISTCTAAGAHSATDDPEIQNQMRTFGEKIGLAFQIRDDLFDFGVADVGKPLGIDLQEKKMTLPLIHALQTATASERKRIIRLVRKDKKSRTDIQEIHAFVNERHGLAYAREKMRTLAEEAETVLNPFADTPARDALRALTRYIIQRKK